MTIAKVDAHHHLWSFPPTHHPALSAPPVERFYGNTAGLQHNFDVQDFAALAAQQNVIRSVYIESHFVPAIEETRFMDAIAETGPFPHAIIGSIDPASTDIDAQIDIHLQSTRFRGVRLTVNWDADPLFRSARQDGLLHDPAWQRGYARLGERGLSVEMMAMPSQLSELARLASASPGTTLIVGHCGLPARRTQDEDDAWRDGMRALAALPHVLVKISGLGMVDHRWTTESIAPLVRYLIDVFGAERCMFGSNFPVDGLHASYADIWTAFEEITSGLSSSDRAALFSETAMRVYRMS